VKRWQSSTDLGYVARCRKCQAVEPVRIQPDGTLSAGFRTYMEGIETLGPLGWSFRSEWFEWDRFEGIPPLPGQRIFYEICPKCK